MTASRQTQTRPRLIDVTHAHGGYTGWPLPPTPDIGQYFEYRPTNAEELATLLQELIADMNQRRRTKAAARINMLVECLGMPPRLKLSDVSPCAHWLRTCRILYQRGLVLFGYQQRGGRIRMFVVEIMPDNFQGAK